MAQDRSLFELVRHPLEVRTLTVKRVVTLTPRMRRVTLAGPELAGFATLAPEDHVRLFFPREGEERPVLPTLGPLGTVLPSPGPKPVSRDYTPRRYDPHAGELDIDFFLHGQGPAAAWAERAREGSVLGVAGPRGSFVLRERFGFHLFVGDETALPEFARRIEELAPGTRVLALLVVSGPDEEQALTAAGPLTLHWVHRAHGAHDVSDALLSLLDEHALPERDVFAWLAGEASEVRKVYRYLVQQRGLPRARVHASGHWCRGVSNHDHHTAIELSEA